MKNFILFFMIFFIIGCSPKEFKPFKPPTLSFNATEEYKLDLSSIKKPDTIKPIFMDKDFNVVSIENASYVVLNPSEYSKIDTILKIAGAYKKIVIEESNLINLHINTINSLKEILEIERNKSLQYREFWINAENSYRYEKYEHSKDNFINKSGMYLISVGSIILIMGI